MVTLLQRIGRYRNPRLKFIAVLTDGLESCINGTLPTIAPLSMPLKVVMVLVPGEEKTPASSRTYAKIEARWKRAAPWVRVIPAFELADELKSLKRTDNTRLMEIGEDLRILKHSINEAALSVHRRAQVGQSRLSRSGTRGGRIHGDARRTGDRQNPRASGPCRVLPPAV